MLTGFLPGSAMNSSAVGLYRDCLKFVVVKEGLSVEAAWGLVDAKVELELAWFRELPLLRVSCHISISVLKLTLRCL